MDLVGRYASKEVGTEAERHPDALPLWFFIQPHCPSTLFPRRVLQPVQRGCFQLVGAACIWIAAKYEEKEPPCSQDMVVLTNYTYSKLVSGEMHEVGLGDEELWQRVGDGRLAQQAASPIALRT